MRNRWDADHDDEKEEEEEKVGQDWFDDDDFGPMGKGPMLRHMHGMKLQ